MIYEKVLVRSLMRFCTLFSCRFPNFVKFSTTFLTKSWFMGRCLVGFMSNKQSSAFGDIYFLFSKFQYIIFDSTKLTNYYYKCSIFFRKLPTFRRLLKFRIFSILKFSVGPSYLSIGAMILVSNVVINNSDQCLHG